MKKTIFALAAASALVLPAQVLAQDFDDAEVVAPAEAKAGLRIEGRAFYERLNDPEESEGINYEFGNGVAFGGEIAYDVVAGENWVVGPYFTYDTSNVETCEDGLCVASNGYWAAGIHAGLTTGEKGLIYGKLGYGKQTVEVVGTWTDPTDGMTYTFDEQDKGAGYNFALGYEHGFSETMYGRVEMGVSESYDVFGFDIQRVTFGVSAGARF